MLIKANHTYTRITRASRFAACDDRKEDLELGIEQCNVLATKDLGNKGAARAKDVGGDIEGLPDRNFRRS